MFVSLFPWFEEYTFRTEHAFLWHIIIDRKSKYSVSGGRVAWSKDAIKNRLDSYLADKYFRKATHNSYAYRFRDSDWFIIEKKEDDGETGAWQVILTQMQRENIVNWIIVVTRYYGWIKLYGDRFRHVVDASQQFINTYKSKQ